MRLIYKFQAENIWFSKNGAKAYTQRGEKPKFLWPKDTSLIPTDVHHIAREYAHGQYTRELVMFYIQAK